MAERFKVDVFALHYAMKIGKHLECIEDLWGSAIREASPDSALLRSRQIRGECGKLIQTLRMLEMHFNDEIPKEKPQLRSVGEK